jgi:acetylornithine deacetylase/succinyl-diaminopimelate desuccinylase-like protein
MDAILRRSAFLCNIVLLVLVANGAPTAQTTTSDLHRTGRDLLKELIETDTTHSSGSTTLAAERMAARLLAAGFPRADVVVAGEADRKGNLVARLRGSGGGKKPILFLAHLDVVEAKKEDWTMDPFVLNEKEGYFYGRGTLDVKGGSAILVAVFSAWKQQGFVPDRDFILALTADEEGGTNNGVSWLLANRRNLIDAEFCINVDSGGGELRGGKVVALDVQAAEKVYVSFSLTVKNPGGHSSLPVKENAIYRLAAGLQRLSTYEFPMRTNEVTRSYFEGMAKLGGASAADMRAVGGATMDAAAATRLSAASPLYNAQLRTTCVPTMLQGGHAENALPQTARATVNCRMLPDDDPQAVRQALVGAVGDPQVDIAQIAPPSRGPASPLTPDLFKSIDAASRATWGGIPVIPFMETGATDGLFLRNAGIPVYGVSPIPYEVDDVRAHGKDERILVRSFYEGIDFMMRLGAALGGRSAAGGAR